jgi:hypothetical protein
MGPSHPATHGVLRLVLELDGEIITKADPDVGFLHRGDEKIAENMHYNQFVPYTDRLDYLAPLANNVAYACAVEKLMGWTLPARGQAIRVICCEMARISSHLLGVGVFAMDVGAMSAFLYTFTEREKIYDLSEQLTGARFTTSFTRIGGQTRDVNEAFISGLKKFLEEVVPVIDELDALLSKNRIFIDRTQGLGVISKEDAVSFGLSGPNLRGSGVDHDIRKVHPYLGYEQYGYHFHLARAAWPGETSGAFDLELTIQNQGVAPIYIPCAVAVALIDESGKRVATDWPAAFQPKQWQPDQATKQTANVKFAQVAPGRYRLALGLTRMADSAKPFVKFGTDLPVVDGWYELGPLTVR